MKKMLSNSLWIMVVLLLLPGMSPAQDRTIRRQGPVKSSGADAEGRLALLIGNSAYTHGGTLRNTVNDVRDMKAALEGLGFRVIKFEDCTQKSMKTAIDDFGKELKGHEVGLFFYAGHGVQVGGANYLIPVDVELQSEEVVEYDCVRADRVLAMMEGAGLKTNIVILDACRDNPFERGWRRSGSGLGLAFMNAPSGALIAYATAPGKTAKDGTGRNGVYTTALLEHIRTSDLSVLQMFQRVRTAVEERTRGAQTPWESTSLKGDFYFVPRSVAAVPAQPAPAAAYGQEVGRDGVYIAFANGIVKDTKTGLEWVAGPDEDMTWDEAKAWVESLKVGGGGWRMPTVKELEGLYQEGKGDRNMTTLLKTTGGRVWSGETKDSLDAWDFIFLKGLRNFLNRSRSNISRAFAVRSRSSG